MIPTRSEDIAVVNGAVILSSFITPAIVNTLCIKYRMKIRHADGQQGEENFGTCHCRYISVKNIEQ